MERWKIVTLWIAVVLLAMSLSVCQKKADQAKSASPASKEAELSATSEKPGTAAETAEATKPGEKAATPEATKPAETPKPAEAAPATPAKAITKDNAAAIIEMAKGGKIVIEFYPKDAPNTVDNFVKLTNKGFYNGLTFHRVIPGFVAQGGDPDGNGLGGPGYHIKAEFNKQLHKTGTVAMARSPEPDSAGSQFYICLAPQPSLDGQYTVFGQVVEGMDVVNKIVIGDVMKKVTIVDKATIKKPQ